MTPSEILYNSAILYLGTDATPNDEVPDEVGCADAVNSIYKKAFGRPIGGGASTRLLYQALYQSTIFKQVYDPGEGDIIISPTGSSSIRGNVGHCGIVGKNEGPDGTLWIMSNDSRTGTWEANYTIGSWKRAFTRRGFPVIFFRQV